ncbi:MAG: ABC transporter ATP-binding protein [Candidatus Hodarchaeales archaeon]
MKYLTEEFLFDGSIETAIFAGINQFDEITEWVSTRKNQIINFKLTGTWGSEDRLLSAEGIFLKSWRGDVFPDDIYLLITKAKVDNPEQPDIFCPRFLHLHRGITARVFGIRRFETPQKETQVFDTILLENEFKRDLHDSMFYRQKEFPVAAKWASDFIKTFNVKIIVEGVLHISGRKNIRCLVTGFVRHTQEEDIFIEVQDALNLEDPDDKSISEFLKIAWLFRVTQRFKGANWIEPRYTYLELTEDIQLSSEALEIRNLNVSFGEKHVLKDVSFVHPQGAILGIIGESGAGKSTLLKAILGEIDYTGSIKVFGIDARDTKTIAPSIGYVPQDLSMQYARFNPLENILAFASQFNLPQELVLQRGKKILEELQLTSAAPIEDLSGGQKRRASIAIALAHNPKMLFLDEPTSGLDPKTRFELWKYLDIINKEYGVTICVISHYLDEIEFCDKAAIFLNGVGMYDFGSPEQLKSSIPGKGLALEITLESVSMRSVQLLRDIDGVDFVIQRGERLRLLSDLPSEELAEKALELLDKEHISIHSIEFKVEIDMVDYFTYISKQRDIELAKEKK